MQFYETGKQAVYEVTNYKVPADINLAQLYAGSRHPTRLCKGDTDRRERWLHLHLPPGFLTLSYTMHLFRILLLLLISVSLKAQTVYKTPSGAKYHTDKCHMVKNVSEAISISNASKSGLQPCKICMPATEASQNLVSSKPQGSNTATIQCSGLTKAGTRCKHMTRIANGYCFQHQPKE
jgi:hypothetical protein